MCLRRLARRTIAVLTGDFARIAGGEVFSPRSQLPFDKRNNSIPNQTCGSELRLI